MPNYVFLVCLEEELLDPLPPRSCRGALGCTAGWWVPASSKAAQLGARLQPRYWDTYKEEFSECWHLLHPQWAQTQAQPCFQSPGT